MIKGNIKNANLYYDFSELVAVGLKYLENTDFSSMANGRYEILSDKVYALVQDYSSKLKSDGKFEAHKKYIDIQYVVKGEEQMGAASVDDFTDAVDYNEEKDIVFLSPKENCRQDFVKVGEKEFIIFEPKDAHMPSIAIEEPAYVKKVVVKVQV